MPEIIDVEVHLPDSPGEETMDKDNLLVAMTAMGNEFGAAAARRVNRFDQLGADAAAMWSVAMTSPTIFAAQGARMMTESGSGRTRAEANRPSETSAAAAG